MMRKISFIAFFFVAMLILNVSLVHADDWPEPGPFSVVSEDENRVFHFGNLPTGVYSNSNPPSLIYLVEMQSTFLWEADFFFSQDMQYFAWIPQANTYGSSMDATEATAIVFYANGKEQKTYMVSDLVINLDLLEYSTTTATWAERWDNGSNIIIVSNNVLSLKTVDGVSYRFDMTNGEILENTNMPFGISWSNIFIFVVVAIVILIACIAVVVFVKKKSIKPRHD